MAAAPRSVHTLLSWQRDQRTVFFRVLDLTLSEQSYLQSVWSWDFEVATTTPDKLVSDVVTTQINLNTSAKQLATSLTKLLDTIAEESYAVNSSNTEHGTRILRLVFSRASGFVARSDFLVYRLHGAENINSAVSFLEPLSSASGVSPEQATVATTAEDFIRLFEKAIGGIVCRTMMELQGVDFLRQRIDDEFSKRLSVPFIIDQVLTRSRVFWVQGRADIEASRQFYEAARALGITLVVLDQPGHWLEDDNGPHAHYREAFIPMSLDGDDGLTQRVVDAVKSYPHKVDGIVTISDVRLPLVARACEILGIPTSPSEAYFLAGDKGATRQLENDAAQMKEGFVVDTAADLDNILAEQGNVIHYPLIVKPCSGWNSDCVTKVRNRDELCTAIRRASARHALSPNSSTKVVVEPYVDGPEVDANFIILDGEVLFCDISDDFPCSGDGPDGEINATTANFMETLMDVPTNLPAEEQELLRDALARSIFGLGFQSGIFHCEARVRNSCAHYQQAANGIMDLLVKDTENTKQPPSCYLHEVNARSPGYINCVAALLAYGVDYYAVRLLLSLGSRENQRVRVLAQPFLGSRPQYVLGVVVLPPTRAGIMASDDAVEEFLAVRPALRKYVVHYQTIRKKGDFVEGPDSSELFCVGYIIVASRNGRHECLKLAQQVREEFDYRLEDD
ncbi:Nn.00g060140.m01.CDS01 [Neocucurbitaria sp. VM-36]